MTIFLHLNIHYYKLDFIVTVAVTYKIEDFDFKILDFGSEIRTLCKYFAFETTVYDFKLTSLRGSKRIMLHNRAFSI